jgi:hypothetical protein
MGTTKKSVIGIQGKEKVYHMYNLSGSNSDKDILKRKIMDKYSL